MEAKFNAVAKLMDEMIVLKSEGILKDRIETINDNLKKRSNSEMEIDEEKILEEMNKYQDQCLKAVDKLLKKIIEQDYHFISKRILGKKTKSIPAAVKRTLKEKHERRLAEEENFMANKFAALIEEARKAKQKNGHT